MRLQTRFLLFFTGIWLISCSPAADPDAIPGLLIAEIDGKRVMATSEIFEAVSSDPETHRKDSQLHFIFTDSLTGKELFSGIAFHFKSRPGKLKTTDVLPLWPDTSSTAENTSDSLSAEAENTAGEEMYTLEMEITRYEHIDKYNVRISGRLHGKVYAYDRLPDGTKPFIEIKNGVFTDIDVLRM